MYQNNNQPSVLDIGCGRGEFLRGFIDCGVQGYGVDRSHAAERYCPEADLKTADLENEPLPYPDQHQNWTVSFRADQPQ